MRTTVGTPVCRPPLLVPSSIASEPTSAWRAFSPDPRPDLLTRSESSWIQRTPGKATSSTSYAFRGEVNSGPS